MGRHKKESTEKYYLGNTRLPGVGAEYEYTPEMVNDLKKSKKSLLYFAENFFYIVNLERGRELIRLHKYQKRILKSLNHNRFCILLSSRQSGKTTLLTIYALWIALFNEDQRILIVANKEQTAKNIFKRVRLAYELLPNYLKAGVIEWGQTSMSLTNGSSIGISTTSSDAGRGESVNCLILDELAFIEPGMLDSFWRSVYPIISSSKKSKILVASTPNGVGNLFHNLYIGAKAGENGWHAERVDWWEVPGRDEEWKENTIKTLQSKEAFMQEYENVFLSSGENIFYEGVYENLEGGIMDPEFIFDEGSYLIWQEPKESRLYVAGVDVGEGLNLNASCIQILDITDLTNIEQVACYNNRKISPYNFTKKLKEILTQWGNPPVCIERNNCGAQVVDNLKNSYGYENIVTWGAKSGEYSQNNRFGILSHTNTKSRGITNMRYWSNEIKVVKLRDVKTLLEMKDFIRFPNGTWGSRVNSIFDDRVMALVWALIILENEICQRFYEVIKYDDNQRPLLLKDLDYGVRTIVSPVGLYTNEKENPSETPLPTMFMEPSYKENESTGDFELDGLIQAGWSFLR
jgi:hypothetical protein